MYLHSCSGQPPKVQVASETCSFSPSHRRSISLFHPHLLHPHHLFIRLSFASHLRPEEETAHSTGVVKVSVTWREYFGHLYIVSTGESMNYSVDETGTINSGKMVRFNLSLPLATSTLDSNVVNGASSNTYNTSMASATVTTSSMVASPNINGCNITYQQQPYNQLHSHSHQPPPPPPPPQVQQQIQCTTALNDVHHHHHQQQQHHHNHHQQSAVPLAQQALTSTNRFYSSIAPETSSSSSPFVAQAAADHRTLLMLHQANSNQVTASIYNSNDEEWSKTGDSKCRRAIVYTIMSTVLIVMLANSLLIAWIISVIHFNPDGIGKLKFESNGLTLGSGGKSDSVAFISGSLRAVQIVSPNFNPEKDIEDQPPLNISSPVAIELTNGLTSLSIINGGKNIDTSTNSASAAARIKSTLNSESESNHVTLTGSVERSGLSGHSATLKSKFIVNASQFVVRDSNGKLNFLIDHSNQIITTNTICLSKSLPIGLNCSLQTPFIWPSNSSLNLKIESMSRNLKILGPTSIQIDSSTGVTNLFSFGKMHIKTKNGPNSGQIVLNSTSVKLVNLPSIFPSKRGSQYPQIMQLCMCPTSGKLYLAQPDSICTFDSDICTKI